MPPPSALSANVAAFSQAHSVAGLQEPVVDGQLQKIASTPSPIQRTQSFSGIRSPSNASPVSLQHAKSEGDLSVKPRTASESSRETIVAVSSHSSVRASELNFFSTSDIVATSAAVSTSTITPSLPDFFVEPFQHWAPEGSVWDSDLVVNKKGEIIQLSDNRGVAAVKAGRARAVTSEDFGFGREEANRLAFNLGTFSCPDEFSMDGELNFGVGLKKGAETRVVENKDRVALAKKYRKTYGLDFPAEGLSHHMGWVEADYTNDSGKQKKCAGVLHSFTLPPERQATAKGTVFLLHGLLGHTGFLPNMIKDLLASGYNVVSLDWPGHGLSVDGKRAGIDSFEAYQAVLKQSLEVIKPIVGGKPLHMVTHSTGGAIALDYLSKPENTAITGGVVPIAPLFYPAVPKKMAPVATAMSRFITWITGKDRTLKPGLLGKTPLLKIANDPIGNFPEKRDIALARDRRMTTKWQKAWSKWVDRIRGRRVANTEVGNRIKILGAANDKIVNTQAGQKHYQRIFSDLQHEVVPSSYHAMHMDSNTYSTTMQRVLEHLKQYPAKPSDDDFTFKLPERELLIEIDEPERELLIEIDELEAEPYQRTKQPSPESTEQKLEPIYSKINPATRKKESVEQTFVSMPPLPERVFMVARLSDRLKAAGTDDECNDIVDSCATELDNTNLSAENRQAIEDLMRAAEKKSNELYKD